MNGQPTADAGKRRELPVAREVQPIVTDIDFENTTQCALITCGYSKGTDFKPAKRPPIETVLHWDGWGGSAPWA